MACAAGRMIRHFSDLHPSVELVGSDIWSTAVLWCQQHLPGRYMVTTTVPHLPFEDRSVDLIFCGSIFTHIDDLADAWLFEMHRVIRPGGRLYITVNDHESLKLLEGHGDPKDYPQFYERTGGKDRWDTFMRNIGPTPELQKFKRHESYRCVIGRSIESHVLWDAETFCQRVSTLFDKASITPAAYGHQTGILLARR